MFAACDKLAVATIRNDDPLSSTRGLTKIMWSHHTKEQHSAMRIKDLQLKMEREGVRFIRRQKLKDKSLSHKCEEKERLQEHSGKAGGRWTGGNWLSRPWKLNLGREGQKLPWFTQRTQEVGALVAQGPLGAEGGVSRVGVVLNVGYKAARVPVPLCLPGHCTSPSRGGQRSITEVPGPAVTGQRWGQEFL